MARLLWDQPGDRWYEMGIDHGVLYLDDRSGVAWNGLTSVTVSSSTRVLTPSYHDGVHFADTQVPGEFTGTLAAFTYPDEFLEYEGGVQQSAGVFFQNQLLKRFHLSYRTLLGNDVSGRNAGHKIHILYNLLAVPEDADFSSLNDSPEATTFSWGLSSVPEIIEGYSPVSHIILDSRLINEDLLLDIETLLWGGETTEAYIPPVADLLEYLTDWVGLTITDNGDGTWTATGSDNYIQEVTSIEYDIVDAETTYLDADTYTITTGSAD